MKAYLQATLLILIATSLATESAARSVIPPDKCACTLQYDPVCGTDKKTYSNGSCAECEGVKVACKGECPCKKLPIGGGHPGACICPAIADPVCGTNRKTYGNECQANCAKVAVDCKGPCPCKKACPLCIRAACSNVKCPAYPHAKCVPKECGCDEYWVVNGHKVDCNKKKPCVCTREYKPVCGTNKKTYSNECTAKCAGATIACKKKCPCEPIACPRCAGDPCSGATCKAYPHAKCRLKNCSCSAEWILNGKVVDCDKRPVACRCTRIYKPVCGYDGKVYSNICEAGCVQMPAKCNGKCPCPCSKPSPRCIGDPCKLNKCRRYPHAKCYADYCGGCNAIFIHDGKVVNCGVKPHPGPLPGPRLCAKKGEKCALNSSHGLALVNKLKRCCHGYHCCEPCPAHHLSSDYYDLDVYSGRCARHCKPCY